MNCLDVCEVKRIGDLSCFKCGYVFPLDLDPAFQFRSDLEGFRTA
jgi:hypothetical protein